MPGDEEGGGDGGPQDELRQRLRGRAADAVVRQPPQVERGQHRIEDEKRRNGEQPDAHEVAPMLEHEAETGHRGGEDRHRALGQCAYPSKYRGFVPGIIPASG